MKVMADETTALKFPIGPFTVKTDIGEQELQTYIRTIEAAPAKYRAVTNGLTPEDLSKTYRHGGWTVHQIVNHVADMQLLHLFRMKKALTETDYKDLTLVNIDGWAQTPDGISAPLEDSLDMVESITKRFVYLMRSLSDTQLSIAYYHPVRKITLDQRQAISMSAWHVEHHLAHIRIALGVK